MVAFLSGGNHKRKVFLTTGTMNEQGRVQEWLNWYAWNAYKASRLSGVRIPALPPIRNYLEVKAPVLQRGTGWIGLGAHGREAWLWRYLGELEV